MKKNNSLIYAASSTFMLCTSSAYANVIWPALFIGEAIFPYKPLAIITILVSIIIEAGLFYHYIPSISHLKALAMSCIGNLVSATIGTIIMTLAMLGWHFLFDMLLGGTFHPINIIASVVLMYLGTALIELLVIKLFFNYSFQTLFAPVFIGNLITYVLAAIIFIYQRPEEFAVITRAFS